jgi:4'-phosphopantetheinyl transferase
MRPDTVILTSATLDAAVPERFIAALTPAEHARAERFREGRDRVQFMAARWLLRSMLQAHLGIEGATIEAPEREKPRLVGDNLPAGLDFNLSHTGGLVACVIGIGVRVGVDVERIDRRVKAGAVAAAHFAPGEQAICRDDQGFLRLWTLKEAVAKAVGLGLALDLRDFTCAIDPPRLVEAGPALGTVADWQLRSWTEGAHHLALAVQGTISDIEIVTTRLAL